MTEGLSGGQTPSCAFLRTHFLFSFRKGNGFALPKEKRAGANRCPEFDSKALSHQLSVPFVPTTRKVSALCASPFGGAAQQDRRLRADEYPQGAGRICNAPSSRTAALGIGPYRVRCKTVKRADRGVRPYRHERSAAEDQAPLGRQCQLRVYLKTALRCAKC